MCVHYVISCGRCEYCTTDRENYCNEYRMIGKDIDGGFAEFAAVPDSNVLRLSKSFPLEQAAILGCAVSTAYHSLRRGRAKADDTVLVNGVGGLGLHAVQLAKKVFRAKQVIAVDISDKKLQLAAAYGASSLVNSSTGDTEKRINELTNGRLADLALDFVGRRSTIEGTLRCVGKGGRLVVIGISSEIISLSPYSSIIGRETEIIGVNDHLKSEMVQLVQFVESGTLTLSESITHTLPLEEVNHGMDVLQNQIGNPIRVVLQN